ncbi:AraC family transcriptional regulator [Microbacterium sp. KUDC0406]|uniref:helix-turn-helix domain-containing protein n=1 Tax=Microbacterium sp. KUDC0406 TaxID=2909588 RepID=UPI001F2A78A2|nr:AraC family transcriptional regulator [Microbacterium sp. KUDC0406]UJP09296.1 AraC family transcriptional regulator [Microbacterium sp. KUDC0406]
MPIAALGSVVAENAIRFLGHEEHVHDEPHLVYVVSGSATLVADGAEIALRRHEAVWLQPRVPHALRVHDGGMVLGPLLDDHAAPAAPVRMLGVVPAVVELMTTVLVAAPPTPEQVLPFRRALGAVLENLTRPRFPVVYPTHPAARLLARDAVRSAGPLNELAARHRMSTRQVQRIFTAETGYPFARWRTRARLNAAVAHILGGGEVTSAARVAGFATRAGLIRALSRETGVPTARIADDPAGALAA